MTRWVLVAVAATSAVVALHRIVSPWDDANLFHRDFLQEHLVAHAIRDGADPYQPLPVMARTYLLEQPSPPWKHASPHPPPAAVAFVPVGLLPFRVGRLVWLAIELSCLWAFVEMISRWWGGVVSWRIKAFAVLASLTAGPVFGDLWNGQFSLFLLLFLTAAWLQLRERTKLSQEVSGGALLGLAIALKLTGWPIAIFLAMQRRWAAVAVCTGVVLSTNLLAAGVLGFETVERYYTVVGPSVARDYRQYLENYSLWSVGSRLFGPNRIHGLFNAVIQPLWPDQALERFLTASLPALILLLSLTLAWRCASFDSAYGILLAAGIPVNPVVWDHSLLMSALPAAICLRRMAYTGFTKIRSALVLIAVAITIPLPHAYLEAVVRLFAMPGAMPGDDQGTILPFLPGLATYLPLVPLGIWTWLLWSTDPLPPGIGVAPGITVGVDEPSVRRTLPS